MTNVIYLSTALTNYLENSIESELVEEARSAIKSGRRIPGAIISAFSRFAEMAQEQSDAIDPEEFSRASAVLDKILRKVSKRPAAIRQKIDAALHTDVNAEINLPPGDIKSTPRAAADRSELRSAIKSYRHALTWHRHKPRFAREAHQLRQQWEGLERGEIIEFSEDDDDMASDARLLSMNAFHR